MAGLPCEHCRERRAGSQQRTDVLGSTRTYSYMWEATRDVGEEVGQVSQNVHESGK